MSTRNLAGERNWITEALNGDDDAFAALVEAYEVPVFNLCFRMLGEAGEAEEAAQEVFLRAYQNLKGYDPEKRFSTWILSIASHYCIDQLRRRRLFTVPLDEIMMGGKGLADHQSPEATLGMKESEMEIQRILGTLRAEDRAAMILLYWYDHSYEEIAALLSISVSAVKSRLHRARREIANSWSAKSMVLVNGGTRDEPSAV